MKTSGEQRFGSLQAGASASKDNGRPLLRNRPLIVP
jgi:hypothetical protein